MIFIGVYRDWFNAVRCVNRLLEQTNEQILIRSDGDYDNKLASQLLQRDRAKLGARGNQVLLVRGKRRLKIVGSGGLYTHHWLSLFLQFSRDSYLIKIDPDTGVNHAPNLPSDNFDVACNYVDGSLRGGAIAFTRRAVQKIVGLQVLFDQKYKPLHWCYRWRKTQWVPCEDAILYDVIQRLGLRLVHWEDVYCRHSEEAFNPLVPLENYSLYHPL